MPLLEGEAGKQSKGLNDDMKESHDLDGEATKPKKSAISESLKAQVDAKAN